MTRDELDAIKAAFRFARPEHTVQRLIAEIDRCWTLLAGEAAAGDFSRWYAEHTAAKEWVGITQITDEYFREWQAAHKTDRVQRAIDEVIEWERGRS